MKKIIPKEIIEKSILRIRNENVMLDRDLASLYGVTTANLNKAVSRNLNRFPKEFMFRLTRKELNDLIFHFGTSSWGGTRKLPRAFTEQGVAMLSAVLRSERAVQVSIQIVKTFVRLRKILEGHKDLIQRLDKLEKKYDRQFAVVFKAIRELMIPQEKSKRRIGY